MTETGFPLSLLLSYVTKHYIDALLNRLHLFSDNTVDHPKQYLPAHLHRYLAAVKIQARNEIVERAVLHTVNGYSFTASVEAARRVAAGPLLLAFRTSAEMSSGGRPWNDSRMIGEKYQYLNSTSISISDSSSSSTATNGSPICAMVLGESPSMGTFTFTATTLLREQGTRSQMTFLSYRLFYYRPRFHMGGASSGLQRL
ncbi:hypothetical protein PMIN06_007975 [Paraphaeosphaeria minitans]